MARNLAETQDFEDAARGLIAPPAGKVLNADGSTRWDWAAAPARVAGTAFAAGCASALNYRARWNRVVHQTAETIAAISGYKVDATIICPARCYRYRRGGDSNENATRC